MIPNEYYITHAGLNFSSRAFLPFSLKTFENKLFTWLQLMNKPFLEIYKHTIFSFCVIFFGLRVISKYNSKKLNEEKKFKFLRGARGKNTEMKNRGRKRFQLIAYESQRKRNFSRKT